MWGTILECEVTRIAPSSADSATSSRRKWHRWNWLQHKNSISVSIADIYIDTISALWIEPARLVILFNRQDLSLGSSSRLLLLLFLCALPPHCILAHTDTHVRPFLAVENCFLPPAVRNPAVRPGFTSLRASVYILGCEVSPLSLSGGLKNMELVIRSSLPS